MPLRIPFAKLFVFFVLLLTAYLQAYSQTIEYTRHTFDLPEYDNLQLIANVSGFHHLLFTKKAVTPTIYLFDNDMQTVGKKELPAKFIGARNMRAISFKNFYLLYFQDSTRKQELWKINGKGEAYSLSNLFQNFVDSTFKIKTSTLTLINDNEQLTVIAEAYYRDLNIMANTVVKVDDKFKVTSSRTFSYRFERGHRLNQVRLAGNDLFILRSGRNSEGYFTDLIKGDLTTGKMFHKTFYSNFNFSGNAAFLYSTADSSILIHSRLGSQIFIAKVDVSLHELVPATLLSTHFNDNVSTDFLLVDGKKQQWLAVTRTAGRTGSQSDANSYTPQPLRGMASPQYSYYSYRNLYETGRQDEARLLYDVNMYPYTSTGFGSYTRGIYSNYNNSTPYTNVPLPALQLSILDKEFKLAKDSVVTNKKSSTTLWPGQYRSITIGHKSYLILKQDLPHKKRGLLLLSSDGNNQISTKDISVLGKYEYLLQCAQNVDDKVVVLPYLEKFQVGLVKLSFADFER